MRLDRRSLINSDRLSFFFSCPQVQANMATPWHLMVHGAANKAKFQMVMMWMGGPWLMSEEHPDTNVHYHAIVWTDRDPKAVQNKMTNTFPGRSNKMSKRVTDVEAVERYVCKGPKDLPYKHDPPVIVSRLGDKYTDALVEQRWNEFWEEWVRRFGPPGKPKRRGVVDEVTAMMTERGLPFTSLNCVKAVESYVVEKRTMYNDFQMVCYAKMVLARNSRAGRMALIGDLVAKMPKFISDEGVEDNLLCLAPLQHAWNEEKGPSPAGSPSEEAADDGEAVEHPEHGAFVQEELCVLHGDGECSVRSVPELHERSTEPGGERHRVQCPVRPVQDHVLCDEVLASHRSLSADSELSELPEAVLDPRLQRPNDPEPAGDEGARGSQDCHLEAGPSSVDEVQAESADSADLHWRWYKQLHPGVRAVDRHGQHRSRALRVQVEHRRSDQHQLQGGHRDHRVLPVQESKVDWKHYHPARNWDD